MGKAKRLSSGNYRVREYDFTDEDGREHYKSFTPVSGGGAYGKEIQSKKGKSF